MAAAVGGIAAPLYQAALLELVEEADDVARIQAQRRAEPVLGIGPRSRSSRSAIR